MLPIYFGCWGKPGHYLWTPKGRNLWVEEINQLPAFLGWSGEGLDGKFCPMDPTEPEGLCALTHRDGCTILAFWDRSGDRRYKSNSAFVLPGLLKQQEALDAARAAFPALFARFTFTVRFTP